MKIAILGYGREGKSLLRFFKKHPRYKKAEIAVLDQKTDKNYLEKLTDFDEIFRSPGVPYNLPQIQRAIKKGVKFSSATKLFFDLCPAPIIGVTGTKGKSTTSTILYKILKTCGKKVFLTGNIGKPAVDILPKLTKNSLVILELSSFQLQDLKKSPSIAVVTDVFPDHLDAHKHMKEYVAAKANIARHQKKSDAIFYFQDNALSREIATYSPGAKIGVVGEPFGLKKNYVMAATVAAYLDCSTEKIFHTLKKFKGVEHRLEFVREIRDVRFYNDSASTNPQTAAAAVLSFSDKVTKQPSNQSLILIAGGKDKNLDYAPLAEAIKKSGNVKLVILFGENKDKIKKALLHVKAPVISLKDLPSAVKTAYQKTMSAKSKSNVKSQMSNVIVLFSPGAASFDMFKDYADRGEQFKLIVKNLK